VKLRTTLATLLGSLWMMSSCVLSSKDERPGGPGEPCVDGTNCRPQLVCFIVENDPESGTCREWPGRCKSEPSCECLEEELASQCPSEVMNCFSLLEDTTVACAPSELREKDDTCSMMRPCEPGLLCHVPDEGVPGECVSGPDCDDLDCDCLFDLAADMCPNDAHGCFIADETATLQCYI